MRYPSRLKACAAAAAILLAAPAAASATAQPGLASAALSSAAPAVKVCGQGAALTRPGSIILACADGRWS